MVIRIGLDPGTFEALGLVLDRLPVVRPRQSEARR
jgi:hypothetical protein